jgi:hypothetical protein
MIVNNGRPVETYASSESQRQQLHQSRLAIPRTPQSFVLDVYNPGHILDDQQAPVIRRIVNVAEE